jgi:hypothetical protein
VFVLQQVFLLKLQLKKKRDDFERALRPLVTMLAAD